MVVWIPRPGAIGIELPVGGLVDALHLPRDPAHLPTEGTITDFRIWWIDERPQIRLMPSNPRYRREDFGTWIRHQKTPAAAAFRAEVGAASLCVKSPGSER